MAASVFHSGFGGTAAISGTELPITSWEVNPTAQLSEFKNSKSGGFVLRETTFKDCSVTLTIDYDFGNDPFGSPLSLFPGVSLSTVNLYLHQTTPDSLTGPAWAFTALVVEGTPQSLAVDGKIQTKIQCRGNGSYTAP